jgi:hypothetical protein
VDYDGLRALETPPATATLVPIPHYRVVDLIKSTLGMYGHIVDDEQYGVTTDGARFFGALSLKSTYGKYTDVCGLRNSHDKSPPCAAATHALTGRVAERPRVTADLHQIIDGVCEHVS